MHKAAVSFLALFIAAGCAALGSERVEVYRTGSDDLLKLRSGPGLGFGIIAGLPDGTALDQYGCVTEVGQRWCEVSLVRSPGMRGYVSADYLRPL